MWHINSIVQMATLSGFFSHGQLRMLKNDLVKLHGNFEMAIYRYQTIGIDIDLDLGALIYLLDGMERIAFPKLKTDPATLLTIKDLEKNYMLLA